MQRFKVVFLLFTRSGLRLQMQLFLVLICCSLLFPVCSNASDSFPQNLSTSNSPSQDAGDLSFVVWGHPRGDFGQPPLHFKEILKRLSELKPDLIIVTGDVIEGGNLLYLKNNRKPHSDPNVIETIKNDWDRFDTAMRKLGIPYYITPGNHDVYSIQTRNIFYSRYPKLPFAITVKGSRFILLDAMGIDKLGKDVDPFAFTGEAVPFDDEQMQFMRTELSLQNKYRHMFFFMHQARQWTNPDGFWWKDIHPMLRGSRTRAVFSGNPDGYKFKYSYLVQDDIYYIQSCTYPVYSAQSTAGAKASRKALSKQLDNFQYVKVNGDDVEIRTIVVGATSSNVRSRRFWDEVDGIDNGTWQRRLVSKLKLNWFNSLKKIFLIFSVSGVVCFFGGILFLLFLRRFKKT